MRRYCWRTVRCGIMQITRPCADPDGSAMRPLPRKRRLWDRQASTGADDAARLACQQAARGLREDTIASRERLVRRFLAFTNEYP